jgi:hypothetical protein
MTNQRTRQAMTVVAIGVLACMACAGGHSEPVPPGAPVAVPAPRITGGDDGQQQEVAFAVHTAAQIYADPAFWALVRARPLWLRAQEPETRRTGAVVPAEVNGDEVATRLLAVRPSDSQYDLVRVFRWYNPWRWIFVGDVNAMTPPCAARTIRLLRRKIADVASLINTVAHENTHIPGMGGGPLGCDGDGAEMNRFTDTPPEASATTWLVSYVIGDLAECYYTSNRDPQQTMACFEHDVDEAGHTRLYRECCAKTNSAVVHSIREQAEQCRPYVGERATACSRLVAQTASSRR